MRIALFAIFLCAAQLVHAQPPASPTTKRTVATKKNTKPSAATQIAEMMSMLDPVVLNDTEVLVLQNVSKSPSETLTQLKRIVNARAARANEEWAARRMDSFTASTDTYPQIMWEVTILQFKKENIYKVKKRFESLTLDDVCKSIKEKSQTP